MIGVILTLTVLNTLMIIGVGLFYFTNNFTIVDLETYNELARAYNEKVKEEEASQELEGGYGGYFREYLDDDYDEEEEEEE